MYEDTLPPGTASLYHLHRDSDGVGWVLDGEVTFKVADEVTVSGPGTCAFMPRGVAHAWKNTGRATGRVLFLYTPAAAWRQFRGDCGTPRGPSERRGARRILRALSLGNPRPQSALT